MSNSTHLYGQLFDVLRQYSRASEWHHLKALVWMVTCLGLQWTTEPSGREPLVPRSSHPGSERGATRAAISRQRADSGECFIGALGASGLEWRETVAAVFSFGADQAVGASRPDSLVGRVSLTISKPPLDERLGLIVQASCVRFEVIGAESGLF